MLPTFLQSSQDPSKLSGTVVNVIGLLVTFVVPPILQTLGINYDLNGLDLDKTIAAVMQVWFSIMALRDLIRKGVHVGASHINRPR